MWLQTEPYQPHSIPPNWGATLPQGPKIQIPHHWATQRKLRPPNSKYEALEISEVGGPFEILVGTQKPFVIDLADFGTQTEKGCPPLA